MPLIAISGPAGSGKDTLGNLLVEKFGGETLSFAKPLKDACGSLFQFTHAQMYDQAGKEVPDPRWSDKTPREILQYVGSDLLRDQFDKDIFLKAMANRIDASKASESQVLAICDCRFENEAAMVRERGGTVVHLFRKLGTRCREQSRL